MARFNHVYLVNSAQSQFSRPPAGLAFMAGVCEHCETPYTVLDLNLDFLEWVGKSTWNAVYAYSLKNLDALPTDLAQQVDKFLQCEIDKIKQSGADCVALTVLTYFNQQWAEHFLRMLRSQCRITVIVGGPGVGVPRYADRNQINSFGRYLAMNDLTDFYVCGEGDVVFKKFLLGQSNALGLNNRHDAETWQPQLDDLDALAAPSYKRIDISRYYSPEQTPVLSITGSRGCVRRCSFCDVGHIWKKYRYRAGNIVAQEIVQHWQDTGAKNFWFTDSLINGSLRQFRDFQTALLEAAQQWPELGSIRYSGQFIIRPRSSHPEKLFRMMSQTGCHNIQVGIESGSEAVREHMGKKFSNADIDYHFEMCEKYGIKSYLLLMVGYPTETREDFEATLDMISRYQKYIINDTALGIQLARPTTILPNTPLFDMRHELGIDDELQFDQDQEWRSSLNPDLTVKERYRRWVELTQTALDLGYNLPSEVLPNLATNIQSWREHVASVESRTALTMHVPAPLINKDTGTYRRSLADKTIPIKVLQ